MTEVLLHTFATRGYLPWVELLLASLRFHSGDRIDVRLDALNLDVNDISRIESEYPNVRVFNQTLTDNDIAAEIEASPDELQQWRSQIEAARTTDRNFWYKIYISVSRRYRSLESVIEYARQAGYKILVHADSDLYVRSDLASSALIEEMHQHDVGFYVNDSLTSLLHIRKVLGAFLCFNLGGNVNPFVERWMSEIDRVPFIQRWKGFGQSVLWYTKNAVEGVNILDLNSINDRFSYSRRFDTRADMWFGSNSKLRFFKLQKKLGLHALLGRAESSRARCWRDLEAQRDGT